MKFFQSSPANDHLGPWRKKQAAMLYHFASLEYLKGLHLMVSNLVNGIVDPLLIRAKAQNRDSVLTDPRWGSRDTSENWSNNAWPFLKDFQSSLVKDIAGRAFERYHITSANECLRGIGEFSMRWATIEEEQQFMEIVKAISEYASNIDDTLNDYHDSRWTDSGFAHSYKKFMTEHRHIPRFQVRKDITGESGKVPSRTGVYVAQDDPHAALQFAWTGNGGGRLRPSQTFNEIGLAALAAVGRQDLWFDDEKMFEFAMQGPYVETFRPTIYMLGEENRDFASLAISQNGYVERPCKWYFVEIVNGEFESIDDISISEPVAQISARISGGEACQQPGYYFTPARADSRRLFALGEIAPEYLSQYGKTIWQWDTKQE
jgi:hypothetical protein